MIFRLIIEFGSMADFLFHRKY